jgi:pimeloyl-ACP methyl ester carboxylesterase
MLLGLLLPVSAFGEYAEIHGIKMYYEIRGEGQPVVLLHGGTSTIETSFSEQIPVLARNHRVIAIEQMGHGHTGDVGGRELSYEGMAEDTAALLVHLGIQNADIVGWSDGGQLALRLAFTHPELVRRVVASGVGLGAVNPQMQQAMRALSADTWPAHVRGNTRAFPRTERRTGPCFSIRCERCGPSRPGAFRSRSLAASKRRC